MIQIGRLINNVGFFSRLMWTVPYLVLFLYGDTDADGFEIPSLDAGRPVESSRKERTQSEETYRPTYQRVRNLNLLSDRLLYFLRCFSINSWLWSFLSDVLRSNSKHEF